MKTSKISFQLVLSKAIHLILAFFMMIFLLSNKTLGQELSSLYTARGYWQETNNMNYQILLKKRLSNQSLNALEEQYFEDFEEYLEVYFRRLSSDEQTKYRELKNQWDLAMTTDSDSDENEFEWRTRDRALNMLYGMYYGTSLVAMIDLESSVAVGIPLITGGLWLMGSSINPDKYEGITRNTIRLSNTGKFFGLGYGAALAATLFNSDSENFYKPMLIFSSLGSIALGEAGFQYQKRHNLSSAHIEMLRHYGILGGLTGLAGAFATESESSNLYGGFVLAGGIVGTLIGNKQAKKYAYTKGDMYAISSLSIAAAGLGFAATAEIMESNSYYYSEKNTQWSFLIPAATAILGTSIAQRQVKGVNLTRKQGSTLALSSAGAGLIGLGLVVAAESYSPAVIIGVPSALAILAHQMVFSSYKSQNIGDRITGKLIKSERVNFAMDVNPANFYANSNQRGINDLYKEGKFEASKPIINLRLKF